MDGGVVTKEGESDMVSVDMMFCGKRSRGSDGGDTNS